MREILHVDMDAFFAAVEQLDDPKLRGRPVVVGGPSRRGVVCAASYEVRPFGVRSAMPMAEALRRCPHALVVPPRHERYAEVSDSVFALFERFTPLVEPLSIDEAFLDVTGSRALFGSGESIARAIKEAVLEETALTASVGVAPSKFIAKIASDLDKPDGLVVVRPEAVSSFLAPLPINKMWGVGPKAEERLRAAGFATFADLARTDLDELERLLGAWGRAIGELARGNDDRPVVPDREAVSIGAEETFEHDIAGADVRSLGQRLLSQSARVARRLVRAGLFARVLTVKVKTSDFKSRTRRTTLPEVACDTVTLHHAALHELERFDLRGQSVRLTGVQTSGLVHEAPLVLFPDPALARRRKVEEVALQVATKFGRGRLVRADLVGEEERSAAQARVDGAPRGKLR